MKKTILLATIAGLAVLTLSAQKPELVLPTIHSNPIQQVCFSADNRFMATCAGTEEIKLWEQKTGRLIRTVQTPLPVSSIALSKDGTRLVCGTYCGVSEYTESADGGKPDINTEVQVWDMVSGKKLRSLKALGQPIRIEPVEISDDGNLALAIFNGQITVWDVRSGAEKWTIEGWGIGDFCPDGAHLMLNQNGTLSLVDSNNGQQTSILNDSCALYACQGDAVVMLTTGMVLKRWDIRSKSFSAEVAVALEADYFGSYPGQDIRFSQDGTQLGVLNTVDFNTAEAYGIRWQFRSFNVHTGKLVSKRDTMEYDGGWGRLTPDLQYYLTSPLVDVADVRAGMSAYSIATGKFSHYYGLKLLEATTDANIIIPLDMKVYNHGKLILVNRESTTGKPNLLFLPERGEAICGVESDSVFLYAENQTLKEDKRWRLECKDNISYQLSNAKNGTLVATLLLADEWGGYNEDEAGYEIAISRIWAVTTPSGLFDASPEMLESLHYVQGMEVIELNQLKTRYYEPYLLQKIMGIMPGGLRPVDELDDVPLFPEILEAIIKDNLLKVRLKSRSGGIGKVALELDGFELVEDVNPGRKADFQLDLKPYLGFFSSDKPNRLSLKLYNDKGWLESQSFKLEHSYDGVSDKGDPDNPRKALNEQGDVMLEKIHFYALVVGTSKYRDASLNLKYPENDAAIFADALRKAGSKLFKNRTEVQLLSTETEPWPRKAEIRKALRDIAVKAGPQDILLVYFSGHGITYPPLSEDGQFYYLTTDIAGDKLKDEAILKTQAIAQDSLMDWVRQVKARKRILIYDACNSGSVVSHFEAGAKDLNTDQRRALERMKDRSGMYVLAGSAADKSSYEASNYGHGLLTYSLINGMLKVAAKNKGAVELGDLFAFVEDDVERLAKNINREQRPEVIKAESYSIGFIDKDSGIKMPMELPVFVRVNLMDGKKNKDLLGLSKTLNSELERISSEKKPALVFWDVESYEGKYYYLGGQYQTVGSVITGKASLYLQDTELTTFNLNGSPDALGKMAKDLLFEVQDYLLKNPTK